MEQQATPVLQIPLVELISGVIRAAGYDPETKTLDVQLASSRVLRFTGVPPAVHKGLMNDGSAHWYYSRYIRTKFPSVDLDSLGLDEGNAPD